MTNEDLEAAVKHSPIIALGRILAGEFDDIEEAETVKQIMFGESGEDLK